MRYAHSKKTIKLYPEKHFRHRFLHGLCKDPQVVIQCCIHHTRVHSINGHWEAASCQLLLKVVGEEHQSQFALCVGTMGTIAHPGDKDGGN